MEKFIIEGGKKLSGEVTVNGAKNAVVAILPATILSDEPCIIENIPGISDVSITLQIMSEMGAKIRMINKNTVEIDTRELKNLSIPYEKAKLMRATTYFLGTLLGRFHSAHVSMPGGCNLGDRPIDQHLKCFAALGAKCEIDGGMAISCGRLRESTQYDYKMVSMSHNTLRGAAGGAVLLAELLTAKGYMD